jgi:hypothetical protein
MKSPSDPIGNRTPDLPACNAVPQPIVPLLTPRKREENVLKSEQVLCALNMSVMVDTVCHLGVSNRTVQKLNLFPLSGIKVPNQLSPLGSSSQNHWTLK